MTSAGDDQRSPHWLVLDNGVGLAAVCVLALFVAQALPLTWGCPFYIDWINHVWMTGYYTDHLQQYGSFPTTVDVEQGFGNPAPYFYGVVFYPLMAIFGAVFGADIAVRLVCAALLAAPIVTFAVLFRRLGVDRLGALLLTICVNASVYQLTNLYARGALTEFVATQLLLIAISTIFYGLIRSHRIGYAAIAFGFSCGALAFGSHPISFYTFSLFIAPFLVLSVLSLRRILVLGSLWHAVGWVILALVLLTPWITTVLMYGDFLHIKTINGLAGTLGYFPTSTDSLWGKIGLFYVDTRVLPRGMDAVSTPFMDAPLAIGLALVVGAVLWRLATVDRLQIMRLIIPFGVIITPLLLAQIPPPHEPVTMPGYSFTVGAEEGPLYALLLPIQFAFRLSGTFVLCLAVALVMGTASLTRRRDGLGTGFHGWVWAGAVIALVCIGQKLFVTYAQFVQYPQHLLLTYTGPPLDKNRLARMSRAPYLSVIEDVSSYPSTFYGVFDFTMPVLYSRAAIPVAPVPLRYEKYGQAVAITCARPCVVQTDIVPSAFHRVLVDGAAPNDLGVAANGNLQFSAGAGPHTVVVEKEGRLTGYVAASVWLILLWVFASGAVLAGLLIQKLIKGGKIRPRRALPAD